MPAALLRAHAACMRSSCSPGRRGCVTVRRAGHAWCSPKAAVERPRGLGRSPFIANERGRERESGPTERAPLQVVSLLKTRTRLGGSCAASSTRRRARLRPSWVPRSTPPVGLTAQTEARPSPASGEVRGSGPGMTICTSSSRESSVQYLGVREMVDTSGVAGRVRVKGRKRVSRPHQQR